MYDKAIGRYWPALTPAADHFELVFLRFVLAGGFAIGMAYVSRRYFEEKFLKLKGRLVPDAQTRPSAEPSNIQLAGLSSSGSLSG
jgi:hypothetical protein